VATTTHKPHSYLHRIFILEVPKIPGTRLLNNKSSSIDIIWCCEKRQFFLFNNY